jgi:Domain of unknown function (DUF1707)/Cell wall-active antibiotics response 4TMS YvqF
MANLPGDTGPSGGPPGLRASDADRDRVSEVLRQAAGEGRLTLDELDERLGAAYAAKTYAELEPIIGDLPPAGDLAAVPAAAYRPGAAATSRFALSIMCGFARAGQWVVPRDFTAIAIMGGGSLDLREAVFAERQVTIRAFALMGGIDITVPEDAEVHVHGMGLMGGLGSPRSSQGRPGAPTVVVQGLALMGGINVRRRPPRGEVRRRNQSERHRDRLEDDGPSELGRPEHHSHEHHSHEHRGSEGGRSEGGRSEGGRFEGGRSESGTDET